MFVEVDESDINKDGESVDDIECFEIFLLDNVMYFLRYNFYVDFCFLLL